CRACFSSSAFLMLSSCRPVWLIAYSAFMPPKSFFFSVLITSLWASRSFTISSTSALSSLVTLEILSIVLIPLEIASSTIKWFGLSLTLTDIDDNRHDAGFKLYFWTKREGRRSARSASTKAALDAHVAPFSDYQLCVACWAAVLVCIHRLHRRHWGWFLWSWRFLLHCRRCCNSRLGFFLYAGFLEYLLDLFQNIRFLDVVLDIVGDEPARLDCKCLLARVLAGDV